MFGARPGPVGEYRTRSLSLERLVAKLGRRKAVHPSHRQRRNFVVGSDALPFVRAVLGLEVRRTGRTTCFIHSTICGDVTLSINSVKIMPECILL